MKGWSVLSSVVVVLMLIMSFPALSLSQEPLSLSTDKESYGLGDLATIRGTTSSPNQAVAIELKDGSEQSVLLRTVVADSNGNFQTQVKLPSSKSSTSYTVIATSNINGQTYSQEKKISLSSSNCLIATAAFGSELAPQVQFLRNFRDGRILSTPAGSSFMSVFNVWYYSFSPYVADFERQHAWLQQGVRIAIYPLLAILTLSENGYSLIAGDYGAIIAGSIASSLIGVAYLSPVGFVLVRRLKTRDEVLRIALKIAIIMLGVSCVGLIISVQFGSEKILMITSSLFVLSLLVSSAVCSIKLLNMTAFWSLGQIRKVV